MTKRLPTIAVLSALFVCTVATASAAPLLVTLDTSTLSGTQMLLFGLTNFDEASNTVSLSEFSFDGGSAIAGTEDCTFGGTFSGLGCSGDLTGNVGLEDLDPLAVVFAQQFSPGASLSFVLNSTNNYTSGTPDQFAMFLCDGGFTSCYSDDATGAMLLLDLIGGTLSPSSVLSYGAGLQHLAAPVVTAVPESVSVPEPSSLLLLGAGLAGLVARADRKRHVTE